MILFSYHNIKIIINTLFIIPTMIVCTLLFPICYILNYFHPQKRILTWFEICDQSWCPEFIVNCSQDMLMNFHFIFAYIFPICDEPTDIIASIMNYCGVTNVIGLCSGGGGNEVFNFLRLKKKVDNLDSIILTDLRPNVNRWKLLVDEYDNNKNIIKYCSKPVDATNVPKNLPGLRWLAVCFHHFDDQLCTRIFQSAVDDNQPIVIVDGKPNMYTILITNVMMFFVHSALVCLEFWRIDKMLCFPIVQLFNLHDNFISSCRCRNETQIREIISKVKNESNFNWIFIDRPFFAHFIVGSPKIRSTKFGGASVESLISEEN